MSASRTRAASRSRGAVASPNFLDHHVESAFFAAMAPVDALDVEGRSAEAFGDAHDFAGRHEEKHCRRIDKAVDQPRTRNAVTLIFGRSRVTQDCAPLRCRAAAVCFRDERQACFRPAGEATVPRRTSAEDAPAFLQLKPQRLRSASGLFRR